MKTTFVQFIVTTVIILSFPNTNFAQRPSLRTAANYVLFTTTGAVGNTGISQIVGNIGTNAGAITGFIPPTNVTGNIDSGNTATAQCAVDLQTVYNELFNTTPTSTGHAPAFGSGETLFAGVYSIAAAGSVAGNLILDAQGNSNALFIFKFGGAFTTGAATTISLTNGALACNIFWMADGAISMAAVTAMKGTLIANNGAISMGAGGILEGRMFSTTGAASVYAVLITIPPCSILPIESMSFTGICDRQNVVLKWNTTTETTKNYFTVERSDEGINWQLVGTLTGTGNTSTLHSYTLTDILPNKKISFYRLKETDINGNYKYGNVITVKNCGDDAANSWAIFPNPSDGKFQLLFTGNTSQVNSIVIFNSQGQKLYSSPVFQSGFDLSGRAPGIYFMHVQQNSKATNLKIVIK